MTYQWFDRAEDCADSAAVLFAEMKWTWAIPAGERFTYRVPNREQILQTLRTMKANAFGKMTETGRLAFNVGKFGHQVAESSK